MGEVILGMPGPWADNNYESSDHYTTKIGGLPDWPVPNIAINPDLLKCSACGSNLCLVVQVYAPSESKTLTIEERVIYVFGCIMPKCGSSPGSWRALRVQKSVCGKESNAPRPEVSPPPESSLSSLKTNWLEDLWTSSSREEDNDGNDNDIDLEELGRAISEAASLACHSKKQGSKCHTEATVKRSPVERAARGIDHNTPVLPCFYVYAREEAFLKEVTATFSNFPSLSIKENQSNLDDHVQEETWEEESYEYDRALNADRTYLKFKKRLDAYPEQCFRYLYGGKPLLASREAGDPGICSLCGGSRHYEMQLMPPVLYFLQEATDDSFKHSLDNWNWMTLIVYTCSKSCSNSAIEEYNSDGWSVAPEAVVVQYE
ncbi:unnamed protein product [Ilex paraguariensis]|uniref:Programmed cell death protein 2 C-terminal domain-containing protein n=1 Tax=Ilex paraguariensis TaxID=185542 RepID=A0ABC8QXC1_9AQUA